jgi:hypothetical protein
MTRNQPSSAVAGLSRRATLASAAALAGILGVGSQARRARGQDASLAALARHPIVGAWLVTTPLGPSLAVFSADGSNIQGVPTVQAGSHGVTFTGAQVGTWTPISDRQVHFTSVQLQTDANGTFVGTVTVDGHPRVSDDGQTLIDDAPETTITIRDAANQVVQVIPGPPHPPVHGVRMGVGAPGFPGGRARATPSA